MSDDVDRAQELETALRADALAAHARKSFAAGESAKWCTGPGCGERIPDARRLAVPGVQFCVECQEWNEQYNP